ncbi:MAG: hypothetical protein HQ565_09900 [Bacteroidetes bacterium]|nr:hypothetical protein [Bacteroidota bacterium]
MILYIVFSYGKNYYQEPFESLWLNLFSTLLGSFIALMIALYIFRKGNKNSDKRKKEETANNYNNRLQYFSLLIQGIIKNAEKQAKHHMDVARSTRESPYEYHLVTRLVSNDVLRITQMDSEEIFRAYLYLFGEGEETIKNYNNIYSSIDFVDEVLKQQMSAQEKHINYVHDDQSRIKDLLNSLADDVALTLKGIRYSFDNPAEYDKEPAVIDLVKLLDKYHELVQNNASLHQVEVEFSKPLRTILIKKHNMQKFTAFLADKSHKAAVLLNHIQYNSIAFAEDVEKIEDGLSEPITKLRDAYDAIEKKLIDN